MQAGAALVSVLLLAAAWCTLHDMQRAEGIGLYYAASTGAGIGDTGMGLAVECAGMLALLAFLLIPCIGCRRRKPDSFLRLLTAYLAFMPVISMASLVHLLNGTEKVKCSEVLLAGNPAQAFREGFSGTASLLSAGLPLLLLLSAAVREAAPRKDSAAVQGIGEEAFHRTGKKRGKPDFWIFAAAGEVLLLFAAAAVPALKDICDFFARYILLVWGFLLWERLYEARPRYKNPGWLIFGIFGLRGLYVMAEVMSVYHL